MNPSNDIQVPGPGGIFRAGPGLHCVTARDERLVQVEADGNAIAGISAVVQVIAITVVVHVYIIVVVPIGIPVLRPRVNQTEPIAAVMEAAMPANIPHGETVDAEPVILAIVATETILRNTIAAVAAALLPGAVLRLPAMCTRSLPCDLLLAYLSRAPSLCRKVVLLLTLLALLILLPLGLLLLLLSCRVVLLLTLLALLILLPLSLLLLFRGVALLLTLLLPLLILLPFGLLLLLLALLILLPIGLRMVLSCRLGRLLLLFSWPVLLLLLLLFLRFILLLLA